MLKLDSMVGKIKRILHPYKGPLHKKGSKVGPDRLFSAIIFKDWHLFCWVASPNNKELTSLLFVSG